MRTKSLPAFVQNRVRVAGSVLPRDFGYDTESARVTECTTVPETGPISSCMIHHYGEDTHTLRPARLTPCVRKVLK